MKRLHVTYLPYPIRRLDRIHCLLPSSPKRSPHSSSLGFQVQPGVYGHTP